MGFLNEIALIPNNTYNYSNSSVFYSLVNANYLTYYQQVVKKSQEWLDGFDPTFHKSEYGILSSRIGAKISKGCAKQIFGRGLVYINGKNTNGSKGVDFISHDWADRTNFGNIVKQLINYNFPLGTALIKINVDAKGELWCEALRADYFYFSTNAKGELETATTFVRVFQDIDKQGRSYCLVERRYFESDYEYIEETLNGVTRKYANLMKGKCVRIPYTENCIFEINSTSNNNTLAANNGKGLDWKSIPTNIQKSIRSCYGDIRIGEKKRLPFVDYLGCELFRNEGGDPSHPGMPFGTPAMYDLIASFMEYDMEISYSMRDLYNSKGIVGIPKALTQSQVVPGTGGNLAKQQTPYGELNIAGYENVPGLDPNTQKPVITQFEMRAVEHEAKQNAILKTIATSIGMSPRVIASYLVGGNEKTAEQVHSEDDTITNWVKNHRNDYLFGLNNIIECVLSYYGIVDNVEVRFASDGLVNEDRQIELIEKKLNLGLIGLDDAIRELYPDLDEVQLKDKIAKTEQRKSVEEQQRLADFNSFGDDLTDGEEI